MVIQYTVCNVELRYSITFTYTVTAQELLNDLIQGLPYPVKFPYPVKYSMRNSVCIFSNQ